MDSPLPDLSQPKSYQPADPNRSYGKHSQANYPEGIRTANQKVPDHAWPAARSLAEAGVPYEQIAQQLGVSRHAIRRRAHLDKWCTPARLSKASRGQLASSDPASSLSALWGERGNSAREMVYQGSKKALERFFAMAPVPQSFSEAAIAEKLLSKAIDPNADKDSRQPNVNLAILATGSFQPSPVLDV